MFKTTTCLTPTLLLLVFSPFVIARNIPDRILPFLPPEPVLQMVHIHGFFNETNPMIKPANVQTYQGEIIFGTDGLFQIPDSFQTIQIQGVNLRNKFNGNGCVDLKVNIYDAYRNKIESILVPGSITCGSNWLWSSNVTFMYSLEHEMLNAKFVGFMFSDFTPQPFELPREVSMDVLTVVFAR